MTVTLVLGGARSGKSEVAERIAARLPQPVAYLATTIVAKDGADPDLEARIDEHRRRRPASWRTLEVGAGLVEALRTETGTVLVDSLGAWLAASDDFDAPAGDLCATLSHRAGATVVVSEEVGLGVHPSTASGLRFRDALGLVNRAVAEVADEVMLVVAGRRLPLDRIEVG